MSTLPIAKRDIVTPFNISAGESASLVVTANNKASLVRQGGFHYSLTMGIRPYNLRVDSQNYRYWDIVTFLNLNPFFYVPIFDMVDSEVYSWDPSGVITAAEDVLPGDNAFIISLNSSTAKFRPGQFIKIGTQDKLYQVRSHSGTSLTLAQPVVAKVTSGDRVRYSQINPTGMPDDHPLRDIRINGVYGKFINEDFGNPINRIEDGIIGNIGPLSLKEKL
jgi:hypothetical protein